MSLSVSALDFSQESEAMVTCDTKDYVLADPSELEHQDKPDQKADLKTSPSRRSKTILHIQVECIGNSYRNNPLRQIDYTHSYGPCHLYHPPDLALYVQVKRIDFPTEPILS